MDWKNCVSHNLANSCSLSLCLSRSLLVYGSSKMLTQFLLITNQSTYMSLIVLRSKGLNQITATSKRGKYFSNTSHIYPPLAYKFLKELKKTHTILIGHRASYTCTYGQRRILVHLGCCRVGGLKEEICKAFSVLCVRQRFGAVTCDT